MKFIKKLIFVNIYLNLINYKRDLSFVDLNFRKIDFTNYKQVKTFIFKENFIKKNYKYVQNFDFLNFSNNLGGKIGINLSKKSIFDWFKRNKNKINFPWSDDYTSKRLINIIYNYEFINSSSTKLESKFLEKIIIIHMQRCIFEFNEKKIGYLTSYDVVAVFLSGFLLERNFKKNIETFKSFISNQIDSLGMHKSYNILEHSKFLNNLIELKNIFLFFGKDVLKIHESTIIQMSSILNEYFHTDGSFPLFNGSNNNYTKNIFNSLNKEEYFRSRNFINSSNGIAFYKDKNKRIFFDIVQPNKEKISSNLSAGTLSFEFSCDNEKIITNCGASESYGKNPEYLRYTAAHSTIVLQNTNVSEIKENNPHLKYPQSVQFDSNEDEKSFVFEGSHNGYTKKFQKILKRSLVINKTENRITGYDTIISLKKITERIIYHIRFHLAENMVFNFTNNKKNIILKTAKNNMWLFKSDSELIVEDSIVVDNNRIGSTKQIVIKGVISNSKIVKKWSLEKI